MSYENDTIAGAFLAGSAAAHGQVSRWIAQTLTQPRFRALRDEWSDLHQEVGRRILESLRDERFDATRDLRVYVQSIARYVARDALMRKFRTRRFGQVESLDVAIEGEEQDLVLTREMATKVMAEVSEPCRSLFRLYFYEEWSHEQIAQELGIAAGTVKSRLFRCLKKTREQWGAEQQAAARG